MKKILGVFLIGICILLSGCTKETDSYEHYHFDAKDLNIYTFYSDSNTKELYALADITPKDSLTVLTGLFYQVDDNDYILLQTLESSHRDAYKESSIYQFYYNKLYGIGVGDTPTIFEIELNGTKSKIKKLEFEFNGKNNSFIDAKLTRIQKIDNNLIILTGLVDYYELKYFECSLKDYKCSIKEQ